LKLFLTLPYIRRRGLPALTKRGAGIISGAQTAIYSLNPDRDIPGPLAINPTYKRLAANHITAQGKGCRASEGKWCGFV